jgi:hypothetical protein
MFVQSFVEFIIFPLDKVRIFRKIFFYIKILRRKNRIILISKPIN